MKEEVARKHQIRIVLITQRLRGFVNGGCVSLEFNDLFVSTDTQEHGIIVVQSALDQPDI